MHMHMHMHMCMHMYRDRSGRMPMKSGRVPISMKRPGSAVPLHMGVCCVEIGDEMVPLKRVGLPLLIHGMSWLTSIDSCQLI